MPFHLEGTEALRAVVEGHRQVMQIVAGHVHRPISYHWGTTMTTTCPSTTPKPDVSCTPTKAQASRTSLRCCSYAGGRVRASLSCHTTTFEPAAGTIEISDFISDWVHEARPPRLRLVEHEVELVMRLCSMISFLDSGRLIASGRPDEISANPTVRRTWESPLYTRL